MVRILEATAIAPYQILLEFSDGSQRVWSAENLLATRTGTLFEPLRDANYFQRFFFGCRRVMLGEWVGIFA